MPAGKTASRFDKEYYDRFYRDPETAAVEPRQYKGLARFVLTYLQYLEIPVRTVLDAGCGLGFWQAALHGFDPDIKYTGIEVSGYLCAEYGWKRASIVDFKPRRRFDLIVCQDVLAYLKDREVRTALTNVAAMCRGALYLQVITKEDWEDDNCDREKTDASMRRRPAGLVPQDSGPGLRQLRRRFVRSQEKRHGSVGAGKGVGAVYDRTFFRLEGGVGTGPAVIDHCSKRGV